MHNKDPFPTSSCKPSFGRILGYFGPLFGSSWKRLGTFWAVLWIILEASLNTLGGSWYILEFSWVVWASLGDLGDSYWAMAWRTRRIRFPPSRTLRSGGILGHFGRLFGSSWKRLVALWGVRGSRRLRDILDPWMPVGVHRQKYMLSSLDGPEG